VGGEPVLRDGGSPAELYSRHFWTSVKKILETVSAVGDRLFISTRCMRGYDDAGRG
jgi:hypothetical protein